MTFFPSSILDALGHEGGLWPGDLGQPSLAAVRERLEAMLGDQPEEVREELLEALGDRGRNAWARAAFGGLSLARSAGSRATAMAAHGCFRMEDPEGEPWALGVLGFEVDEHPSGEPSDVARLTDSLDQTFAERRYVLYLRRAVPSGFDPAPIARAVHLWLGAIDRGEWQGQHAIYEDKDVALELILTGDRGRRPSNRVFTVGPITALERLAGVDSQLVRQTVGYQDEIGELPLACVLGGSEPWRLPRGYVEQLLYGTADFVCVREDSGLYEAGFSPNGRSLFSDPACRNLTSLWWVEPAADVGPLAFRAWAHDNPWTSHGARVPALDARRFAVIRRDEVGARGRKSVVLQWQGDARQARELDW